jgi:hypothetical protein
MCVCVCVYVRLCGCCVDVWVCGCAGVGLWMSWVCGFVDVVGVVRVYVGVWMCVYSVRICATETTFLPLLISLLARQTCNHRLRVF